MYTITFYSFKGGVGRSMALVNVAVQLAVAGKRVLLVDFDLEAPGLPTFGVCRNQKECLGLVDFVTEYTQTGQAPDVQVYVYKSHSFVNGGDIWVMPVGRQDASYSNRLNSINWQNLYSKQNGFLLFEDLKRQWSDTVQPDYVLIDSRTGHSDVEGICTRQLPDAVCLFFFPNEQNLAGLSRVTANIRNYVKRTPRREIDIHFAMSNVPDLDDEDHVLDAITNKFKTQLGYDSLAAEIHHYNSMALLDQEIFSITRPNSKLAKEYSTLVGSITKNNMEDRAAVIAFLKSSQEDFSQVTTRSDPDELRQRIETILKNFANDGEVCFLVALLYEQLGNLMDALSLVESAPVNNGFWNAHMLAVRSRLRHKLRENAAAAEDLWLMLDADKAEFESFMDALTRMEQLAPEIIEHLPKSAALRSLSGPEKLYVANQLDSDSTQITAKIEVLNDLLSQKEGGGDDFKDAVTHILAVTYIGSSDFTLAVKLLEASLSTGNNGRISHFFNLAMAKWGAENSRPLELFKRVGELNDQSGREVATDPNYAQCLAIVHYSLGNVDKGERFLDQARSMINERPRREFSAWSYRKEAPEVFLSHLDDIQELATDESLSPAFIRLRA